MGLRFPEYERKERAMGWILGFSMIAMMQSSVMRQVTEFIFDHGVDAWLVGAIAGFCVWAGWKERIRIDSMIRDEEIGRLIRRRLLEEKARREMRKERPVEY